MKAPLIVCLGNPMMGDDGIGWHLFRHLTNTAAVPEDWEVIFAGTDLFPSASAMVGRRLVVLLDAIEGPPPPGIVEWVDLEQLQLDGPHGGAHQFPVMDSLRLLQLTEEGLADVRFVLLGVRVGEVRFGLDLSAELSARIPQIAHKLIRLMMESCSAGGADVPRANAV